MVKASLFIGGKIPKEPGGFRPLTSTRRPSEVIEQAIERDLVLESGDASGRDRFVSHPEP